MKTKPKTLAALSLALLIITLGYFLHLSNLNRDGVKTDIDFNPMNTTLPTKESMIENRPEPEIEMDTKPHPVLKVTGKQKTPDQESASTIAQMGIATEQEEMEEQVTKAQDTKIAELLEENETKHALPKPKVKVQKNEGQKSTNAAKVPDRARPPTKKPKVDISSPKNTPKDGGIKDVVDKKPKVVTEKITIAVNKPDTGKEVELSTTDSTVNSADDDVESTETDMEAEGKTVPDVKAFNPNQLPWSYDLNEGTCDYDLAFRSEFQIFNTQHHEFRLRLSDADIVKARDDWKSYAKTIKEPKIKFSGRGIVYSG